MLPELNAIVFDLDHTLCHCPLTVEEVLRAALGRTDAPLTLLGSLENAADRYNALWWELEKTPDSTDATRRRIVARLLAECGVENLSLAGAIAGADGDIRCETGVRFFEGVESLLANLRGRCRLGLLTNGPPEIQWEKIHRLNLHPLFDAIFVAEDVGVFKPDVRVFRIVLDRLNATAATSLFVGDSYEMDIIGAHQAGMHTAWILPADATAPGGVSPTIELEAVRALKEILP